MPALLASLGAIFASCGGREVAIFFVTRIRHVGLRQGETLLLGQPSRAVLGVLVACDVVATHSRAPRLHRLRCSLPGRPVRKHISDQKKILRQRLTIPACQSVHWKRCAMTTLCMRVQKFQLPKERSRTLWHVCGSKTETDQQKPSSTPTRTSCKFGQRELFEMLVC